MPARDLYHNAVRRALQKGIFTEALGQMMIEEEKINLVIFRQVDEVIERWIP